MQLPSAFGVYNNRRWTLRQLRKSVGQSLVVGFLFLVPVYLAILLLLKAMKSLGKLVQPIVRLSERVHPLNVPFTQAVKAVTRWGLGSKAL